jgi:DNA-directed RNA polymerase specialized sigma24 family protein
MDDQWLISRCLEGKTAYWQVLVVRYRQQLFDRVSRRLADSDDAWEVVDAAFYHLRGSLATFEQPEPQPSEGFFFHRLLRSAAESFIRKSRGEEA